MNRVLTRGRVIAAVTGVTVGSVVYQQKFKQQYNSGLPFRSTQVLYAEEPRVELNNVQSTVWTGTHPQCVVATIHIKRDKKSREQVLKKVAQIDDIVKKVQGEIVNDEEDEFTLPVIMAGVGFDTRLWKLIATEKGLPLPSNYGEYQRRTGEHGIMPDNSGDLVLHVKASTRSQCYEVVSALVDELDGAVVSVEDRYGWQYRDGRDLSGFLDGTENPATKEERVEAAVIPTTGGSYLLHQVWIHDLKGLKKVMTDEQEKWVGRKKDWSAELTGNDIPVTSHVKRMRDALGNRIPIVRQSMPFGSVGGDSGLLFIAYSNQVQKFDDMLDRMVGKVSSKEKAEDGHNDSIMRFSNCIRGNYFYIPSKTELRKLAQ